VSELLSAVVRVLNEPWEPPVLIRVSTEYRLEPDFQVEREGPLFRVHGKKVERLISMTRFEQDESVARLQKIFRKMGVEKALGKAGAVAGDIVAAGAHEFSYRPEP
jgi:GTP-binding protein